MNNLLYLDNSYLKEFEAVVEYVNDDKYIILDQTAFYPSSGGQPNDTGKMICNGEEYNVVYVTKIDGKVSHEVDNTSSLALTGHIVSNTVLQGQIIITTMYLFGACTIILVGLSLNFIFQGLALQAK